MRGRFIPYPAAAPCGRGGGSGLGAARQQPIKKLPLLFSNFKLKLFPNFQNSFWRAGPWTLTSDPQGGEEMRRGAWRIGGEERTKGEKEERGRGKEEERRGGDEGPEWERSLRSSGPQESDSERTGNDRRVSRFRYIT